MPGRSTTTILFSSQGRSSPSEPVPPDSVVVLAAGRRASKCDGTWSPGVVFSLRQVYTSGGTPAHSFDKIVEQNARALLLAEAEPWLQMDAEAHPDRLRPDELDGLDERRTVGIDRDLGSVLVIWRGAAASYVNGLWQAGVAFSSPSLYEDFRQVSAPEEAWLIDEAQPYLKIGAAEREKSVTDE